MIRIFVYNADKKAYFFTQQYREIATTLGLVEWHPGVWIGRLFAMDNDFGEHWLDNVEDEDAMDAGGYRLVPDCFFFGRAGEKNDEPMHGPEIRARFWHDVLCRLELSLETIIAVAIRYNDEIAASSFSVYWIPNMGERIIAVRERHGHD